MKKLLIAGALLFCLMGCADVMNTPTKRVEEYLMKYQKLDDNVTGQIEDLLTDTNGMTDEQKTTYRDIYKNQYQHLTYTIKDETIDGKDATVETEIEVYNFNLANQEIDKYVSEHQDKFLNDQKQLNESKVTDYTLSTLKNYQKRVKYTINFVLTKVGSVWTLDQLSDVDLQKIHGIYKY